MPRKALLVVNTSKDSLIEEIIQYEKKFVVTGKHPLIELHSSEFRKNLQIGFRTNVLSFDDSTDDCRTGDETSRDSHLVFIDPDVEIATSKIINDVFAKYINVDNLSDQVYLFIHYIIRKAIKNSGGTDLNPSKNEKKETSEDTKYAFGINEHLQVSIPDDNVRRWVQSLG
jgi:hypothetical protein